MRQFLKKKGFLLFIFLPINITFILLGNIRTEGKILKPNEIRLVASAIKLDNVYQSEGTFNTVSVSTRSGTAPILNYLAQREIYTDYYVFSANK